MTPMEKYLNKLIRESEDSVAQVQLMFNPGNSQAAGGLRQHEINGLYELTTVGQPQGAGAPDFIMITQVFAADAIQAVMTAGDVPDEMRPSGILVPEGAGKISGPGFKQ